MSVLLILSFKFPRLRRLKGAYDERARARAEEFLKRAMPLTGALGLALSLVAPLVGLIVVLALIVVIALYSNKLAQRELELEGLEERVRGEPLRLWEGAKCFLVASIAMYVTFVLALVISYSSLPEKVVVHFDASLRPNEWASKSTFVVLYLSVNTIAFALTLAASWWSLKNPAAFPQGYPKSAKVLVALLFSLQMLVGFSSLALMLWNLGTPH